MRRWRRWDSNPHRPRCKRGARPVERRPRGKRGRVESNHHSAEATGLQPAELTGAQRPREKGGRPDSNRYREDHGLGCCRYTTATTDVQGGDDRIRTGGFSADNRALFAAELRPRKWRGWDSNPRSRAHEAREDSPSSTAQVWLAGVEPAISGFRSRWGGQLPYSQMQYPRRDSKAGGDGLSFAPPVPT